MNGETEFTIYFNNTCTCLGCGETITSMDRHDFQTCACGAVSVDGGQDYQRRVAAVDAWWEEWTGAWERDDALAERIERFRADWRRTLFREGAARC